MIIMAFNSNKIQSETIEKDIAKTILQYQYHAPFIVCTKLNKVQASIIAEEVTHQFTPVLVSTHDWWMPNHEYSSSDPSWIDALANVRDDLLPLLNAGKLPILYDEEVSMCTSTVLAVSVGASEIWYWSNSDGIYTDAQTELFAYITMKEAYELALAGKNPIEAPVLLPIKDENVRFRFRNPSHPERVGTIIVSGM